MLRDELAVILSREVQDPRVGLLSVTAVDMSPDLKVAKIYLSPVDPEADVAEIIRVLDRARGFIRMQLTRRKLGLRHMPELRFVHDDSISRGSRIDRILSDLNVDESNTEEEGES
jgi:ribosome-binding factor A